MNKQRSTKASTGASRVTMGVTVDIASAAALRAELDAALDAGGPIELDAGETTRIDTAALQLLTAFFVEAQRRALTVTWSRTHPNVETAAGLLGLSAGLRFKGAATP